MSQIERHKRLRLLLRKLNKQRKQQAKRVDILCNDLIGAQRSFLRRLQDIGFAAEFYRSLLGGTDTNGILVRAGRAIQRELPGTGVAFFLRGPDGYDFHACRVDTSPADGNLGPEEYLDPEMVDHICKYNRPCTLEDIAGMRIDGGPEGLYRFSFITLPLSDLGRSLGFALIYCTLPQVLHPAEIGRISPVMRGLAQALHAVHVPGPHTRKAPVWDPPLSSRE